MSKKMGRPVKQDADRKSSVISLRLKADELKAIDAAAEAAKRKRSDWIRKALTDAASAIQ